MVKTDFKESHHRFDQCGVVMYLDSENWLKGSIEYENDNFQHLGIDPDEHEKDDADDDDVHKKARSAALVLPGTL